MLSNLLCLFPRQQLYRGHWLLSWSFDNLAAGEVVNAFGRMKLGTAPGYYLVHPEFLKQLSPKELTWLANLFTRNDLGTENPKDLETSEDHSLGKTWQRSTSGCKLSTHITPEHMLQAAGMHHLAENLPTVEDLLSVDQAGFTVAAAPATKSQPSQCSLRIGLRRH